MLDPLGAVAEFATANLFLVKDGVVVTPALNGTFLDGVTRQRVIQLLRDDGLRVVEQTVRPDDLLTADEVFSTGNYGKVMAYTKIEESVYPIGPIFTRARELYWDFSHSRRN